MGPHLTVRKLSKEEATGSLGSRKREKGGNKNMRENWGWIVESCVYVSSVSFPLYIPIRVWRLDQWKNPPKEEETHRHNTKKKKRAKCDEVCVCTAVIFPGEMVDYNNMFQNPGERDVGGSSRDQFLLLLAAAASSSRRLCILFSVLTLFIFFSFLFSTTVAKAHTHAQKVLTHTQTSSSLLFVVFVFVL